MKIFHRLLDKSMNEKTRINALSLGLNLSGDTVSNAHMQFRIGDYDVAIGDWVEIFTNVGSAGFFRVMEIENNYFSNLCDISLEHGFGTLADRVIRGKLDAQIIAAKDEASVSAYINVLLSSQNLWELDECEFDNNISLSFEDVNVLDCIRKVLESVGDYWLSFDQRSTPWKFSIHKSLADEDASCEMRMSRNIKDMQVILDRKDLFTKIYPYGKDGITIEDVNDGKAYVEKNANLWGYVEKIHTFPDITNKDELKSAAEVLLYQKCNPIVTVKIDGSAISQFTGEPFDNIKIGSVCRIPLHFGLLVDVINGRVMGVSWPDVVNQPDVISVTLSNRRKTGSSLISAALAKASAIETTMEKKNGEIKAASL